MSRPPLGVVFTYMGLPPLFFVFFLFLTQGLISNTCKYWLSAWLVLWHYSMVFIKNILFLLSACLLFFPEGKRGVVVGTLQSASLRSCSKRTWACSANLDEPRMVFEHNPSTNKNVCLFCFPPRIKHVVMVVTLQSVSVEFRESPSCSVNRLVTLEWTNKAVIASPSDLLAKESNQHRVVSVIDIYSHQKSRPTRLQIAPSNPQSSSRSKSPSIPAPSPWSTNSDKSSIIASASASSHPELAVSLRKRGCFSFCCCCCVPLPLIGNLVLEREDWMVVRIGSIDVPRRSSSSSIICGWEGEWLGNGEWGMGISGKRGTHDVEFDRGCRC